MHKHAFRSILVIAVLTLAGCATPYVQPPASSPTRPVLQEALAIMEDGYRLPLKSWQATGESRAVLLALHGLNDYRNGFASTGDYLARLGITVIAYDQRGFGNSDGHGLWHGRDRLIEDLRTLIALLHAKYPGQPLYLLGESMGGAVVLASLTSVPLAVDGIILVAPAVWSRAGMPCYQRLALWLAAHIMPAHTLTGEGLDLHPSDNFDMLRALSRDPLVIKATRVDVLYGVSNLMDQAVGQGNHMNKRALILYGKHDDIIPREPTCQWLQSLPAENSQLRQILIYENGYHMLTRDLQAKVVLKDIADWITGEVNPITNRQDISTIETFCPEVTAPR